MNKVSTNRNNDQYNIHHRGSASWALSNPVESTHPKMDGVINRCPTSLQRVGYFSPNAKL